jgi:hypothetical protein
MAESNGYTAEQSSELYLTSGTYRDWLYERHRVFAYTFELTTGSYPDDSQIALETSRNIDALLYAAEHADCPYRAAGLAEHHCGPFADDFEAARGWVADADAHDTATSGRWERADPERTDGKSGTRQFANVTSGRRGLVTGPLAGTGAGEHDVDGGTTTIRSRPFPLPAASAGAAHQLRFQWTFSHNSRSTADDRFVVSVVDTADTRTPVFTLEGSATDRLASWRPAIVELTRWAGETVSLQLEATDGGPDSLVEVAVDDVSVWTIEPVTLRQRGLAPTR